MFETLDHDGLKHLLIIVPIDIGVVCIASIASEIAFPAAPIYVATKWGVSGFVRSLDVLEPQYGIRVNAVAPGIGRSFWPRTKDQ